MTGITAVGFVNNARSERNKRGFAGLDAVLAAHPEVTRLDFDGLRHLRDIAADLAHLRPGLIVVNGGDGTVQGLLTELLEDRPLAVIPPIAILPRGMANMTAADCGLRRRGARALRQVLEAVREGSLDRFLVRRRVLRVANLEGGRVQRGMFMGALGITDAIHLCKRRVHSLGLKGELAHLVTLVGIVWRLAHGRPPSGMFTGARVGMRFEGGQTRDGSQILLLATTLDRLVLASRPFWNAIGRPVRFTAISQTPERLLQTALKVLYGGDRRSVPETSYFSRGCEQVDLDLESEVTIDGQFFAPAGGRPLAVSAPDELSFVRL